jgi:hypothetical protein
MEIINENQTIIYMNNEHLKINLVNFENLDFLIEK